MFSVAAVPMRQTKFFIIMKKLFWAAAIAAAWLMTGCAASTHLTSNHNLTQTNVELSQKNYRVVGTVQGSETISRIFGIGGLSKRSIRENAYNEMVKNANLTGSQAIINTTTDTKFRGVPPFYLRQVVTTYGQVIEFTE